MDDETRLALAALEARFHAELATLKPEPKGKVIWLKQEAADLGIDAETLRRRILDDPSWQKVCGRWCRDA